MDLDRDVEICKANSGAIRFQVKSFSGLSQLYLIEMRPPYRELFDVILSPRSSVKCLVSPNPDVISVETEFIDIEGQFQEFWLTWYNSLISIGLGDNTEPFIRFKYEIKDMIGYIKFVRKGLTNHLIEWLYENPPVISKALEPKKLNWGDLHWVSLIDHQLPPDALIGGFENEPLYIARAEHNTSICPGKYVPSKRRAFVPWGGREHAKDVFQILCGYNATWVKTGSHKIPQNAFIAGTSEVRREPLYIGRIPHEGHLINGKIHAIWGCCYVPYQGKEVENYAEFEILVLPDKNYRGIFGESVFDEYV